MRRRALIAGLCGGVLGAIATAIKEASPYVLPQGHCSQIPCGASPSVNAVHILAAFGIMAVVGAVLYVMADVLTARLFDM